MSILSTIKSLFSNKNDAEEPEVTISIREDEDEEWSQDQYYKEHLQYAIERGDQKEILYYQGKLDPEFRIIEDQYWGARNRIKEMQVDQTVNKEDFEKECKAQMTRAYAFKRPYEHYYSQPLYADVFKIYAIFLEREGRYVDAATVCARALRWGFPNDRTQGGMKGRLMRLVKKAGGEINGEIEDALKKFCQ